MDIDKIASLARLQLSENEKNNFKDQMKSILSYFEQLSEVDTKGVEPMVTPTVLDKNFRDDKKVNWEGSSLALELAPQKKGNLYQVPPVV